MNLLYISFEGYILIHPNVLLYESFDLIITGIEILIDITNVIVYAQFLHDKNYKLAYSIGKKTIISISVCLFLFFCTLYIVVDSYIEMRLLDSLFFPILFTAIIFYGKHQNRKTK